MKRLRITVDGKVFEVEVESLDTETRDGGASAPPTSSPVAPPPASAAPIPSPSDAPPGAVVSIDCQPGQKVAAGATLITLEAMKMNILISAPVAGEVASIAIGVGDAVDEGQLLVSLK